MQLASVYTRGGILTGIEIKARATASALRSVALPMLNDGALRGRGERKSRSANE